MLDPLKYLEYYWPRRKTKYGLLLLLIAIFVILAALLDHPNIDLMTKSVKIVVVLILGWIAWLFHSGRRSLPSNKFVIAFSIRSLTPQAQQVIKMTNVLIQEKFKHLDIVELFHLKDIGTDIFSTRKKAQDFIMQRKYNMVIHGTVIDGNVDGKYVYDLKNFIFTYRILARDNAPSIIAEIKKDIDQFALHRDWQIAKSNDKIDIEKVANNLVEMILIIIALGLATSAKHVLSSIKLIETLLPEIERKALSRGESIKIDPKQKQITMSIELLRSGRLRNILANIYISYSMYLYDKEDFEAAIEQAEKGLKAGAVPIIAHASIALASFHLGKLEDSERHVDDMGRIDSNHPLYLVNKAFFYILHKKYDKVVELYKKIPDLKEDKDDIIFQVISFLSVQIVNNVDEIAYVFASGFLNYNFADKERGLDELNLFKRKSKNISKYSAMYDVANSLG